MWQRHLAQGLLYVADTLAILRQVGIRVGQGILQVPHEVTLQLPLAGEGLLPLSRHPVFDPFRSAVPAILDHPVNPERGHLLLAAGGRRIHGIDHAAGQRRQETPGQQTEVRLINGRPDGTALVQPQIRNTRPRSAVVAKHCYRIADLVQRLQQVAPGRVQTLIHFVMAVLPALGQHAGGLDAIDVEVTMPAGNSDTEGQDAYRSTHPQQLSLAPCHPDVVAGKAGLLVDDPPKGLLNEVGQRLALRLALQQGEAGLVRLRRLTDKGVAHVTVLYD
ncbi:hypothetical protein D3C80_542600 [compost metagenome]